jgi:hypothetical protein
LVSTACRIASVIVKACCAELGATGARQNTAAAVNLVSTRTLAPTLYIYG